MALFAEKNVLFRFPAIPKLFVIEFEFKTKNATSTKKTQKRAKKRIKPRSAIRHFLTVSTQVKHYEFPTE